MSFKHIPGERDIAFVGDSEDYCNRSRGSTPNDLLRHRQLRLWEPEHLF